MHIDHLFDGWNVLTAKSKVFLVGEYAVLFGGNAILLSIEPSFRLKFRKSVDIGRLQNYANSPAFGFFEQHKDFFKKFDIEFEDPYNGAGGFGASSAQYVLLYKLYEKYNCSKLISEQEKLKNCLNIYKALPSNKGINPSGADCAAQYVNRHIFFDGSKHEATPLSWNFPNLDFYAVKTCHKINTHEHLKNLKNIDISDMAIPIQNVKQAFENTDEKLLVENINLFFNYMIKKNIVIPETIDLVKKIQMKKSIRAIKGCGALAADVVVVIFDKTQEKPQTIKNFINVLVDDTKTTIKIK